MTDDGVRLILGLLPFAAAMSFTPGPNNLLLASSAATFGFAKTIPQQLGVVIGFAVMTLVVGVGLATLLTRIPVLLPVFRIASIAYMLFLAWRIWTSSGIPRSEEARPSGFLAMAVLQWINPKGWMMVLGAVPAFTTSPAHALRDAVLITTGFAGVGLASCATWALLGTAAGRLLKSERRLRLFNRAMALLLVASLTPVALELRP